MSREILAIDLIELMKCKMRCGELWQFAKVTTPNIKLELDFKIIFSSFKHQSIM